MDTEDNPSERTECPSTSSRSIEEAVESENVQEEVENLEKTHFLVKGSHILSLFQSCYFCGADYKTADKKLGNTGTCPHVEAKCSHCEKVLKWSGQDYNPHEVGKFYEGNLLLICSAITTGNRISVCNFCSKNCYSKSLDSSNTVA